MTRGLTLLLRAQARVRVTANSCGCRSSVFKGVHPALPKTGPISIAFVSCRQTCTVTVVARAGDTVNVPANAPHVFRNATDQPARLLCLCSPSGQEEFFVAVGVPVASRTEPPPVLDDAGTAAFIARATALAPQYRTELLPPDPSA